MPDKDNRSQRNNFDLLRLVLAVLVLRCHAGLLGLSLPWTEDRYFLGGRSAVECFFVISGFLIFKSWESKPQLGNYIEKRARRILPAYVFVVVGCALGLSLVSRLSFVEYFTHHEVWKYITAHLAFVGFLQNTLPGVFTESVQSYTNGPLWTIKIEVMFYACVPLIAVLAKRLHRGGFFLLIYLLALTWKMGLEWAAVEYARPGLQTLASQLPGQMSFFIAGGALHYYQDVFARHRGWLFACAAAGLLAYYNLGWWLIYPAALAIAVIYVAIYLPFLGNFARYGDLSYGLYIYHFPIFQVIASLKLTHSPILAFAGGSLLAVMTAWLSWHYLESRWLHASSHYMQSWRVDKPEATIEKANVRDSNVSIS